jgi:hypothetical protein
MDNANQNPKNPQRPDTGQPEKGAGPQKDSGTNRPQQGGANPDKQNWNPKPGGQQGGKQGGNR